MKNVNLTPRTFSRLLVSVLALLLVPLMVSGQNPDSANQKPTASLAGKYEGTAKGPEGDVQVSLDLADEAGKFSGRVTTPRGVYDVQKGQMVEGLLSLELAGKASVAKLTLRQRDDKLAGELSVDGKKGPIELKRIPKDEVSGEWDAAADAQGQAFPFTLVLKLEGEKVTGSSSSQLGNSSISSGSWKDGKLALILDGGSAQTALIATMVDGKLVGDYDYGGQLQGKWVAAKKKP
jgi:hypothetical protein